MVWLIANIDDLSNTEKLELNNYVHYKVFRGLFIISEVDVLNWKKIYGFDDWIMVKFPEGYLLRGWFSEELDHDYDFISDFIYNKNKKAYENLLKVLDGIHKTKSMEDIENHILSKLNNWSEVDFKKHDSNRSENLTWLSNEIIKALR